MSPCQPITERCVFRQIFRHFVFIYLGLKESLNSRRGKNEKRPSSTGRQGFIEHVCAKNQDISSKDGVNIWAFVRKTCNLRTYVYVVVALSLLSFSIGSPFDVNYDVILALRSHIFEYMREDFYRRHAVWSHGVRHRHDLQKNMGGKKNPTETPDSVIDLFEGPWLIGTHFFSPLAPASTKQLLRSTGWFRLNAQNCVPD